MLLIKKDRSIFYRLLTSSLVFVFSIVITLSVIFYYFSKNDIENHLKDIIHQQLNSIASDFKNIKKDLKSDLKLIASNPIVDDFLMSSKLNYEINARALEKLFIEYTGHSESWQRVYLIDYLGKEKVRVDKKSGRIKEHRELSESELFRYIESNTRGKIGVESVYVENNGDIEFVIGTNLIDGDIGEFGGSIFVGYSLNEFLESLNKFKFNGVNNIWVFSSDGTMLKKPLNGQVSINPKLFMTSGYSNELTYIEHDNGMLVYQDMAMVNNVSFIRIAISVPFSLMLQDVKSILRFSLIIFLIFTFVIVFSVLFQSKRFSRPIVELSKAASNLADGNLSVGVNVKADGEMKILVDSFNKMAKDLKLSQIKIVQRNEELDALNEELATINEELESVNEELEERVDERTKELKEAQKIAKLGSWEWDVVTDEIKWSDEARSILEINKDCSEMTFEDYLKFIHPDDRERFLTLMENVSNGFVNVPTEEEYRVVLPDGKEKYLLDIGVVNYDENNKPIKMTGTIQDITERKKAEREKEDLWHQLLQSQKMESIGVLSGRVAHDFNNMLTPIVGYSSLAIEILPDGSKVKEMVQRIFNTSKKATKLIDQLLTYSRKQVFDRSPCDLCHVVNEMRTLLISVIGEDVTLKLDLDSDAKKIIGDVTQLQQVILNLVVNARQAMPEGGNLTISTQQLEIDDEYSKAHQGVVKGIYCVLSVEDTGVGMSPEVQMRIFDPFFTTREHEKGSGLGLSTVYGIVRQHNGFIWDYSELNKGTIFKVYFPVSLLETKAEEEIKDTKKEISEVIVEGGTETVLVVDDKAIIHRLIGDILRPNGYTVLEAENAKEAIKIFDEYDSKIELIISDVVMPEISGWELYLMVRGKKPRIKVLFTSGFVENPIVLNDIQKKGFPFIKKPLNPHELLSKVREVLDGRKTSSVVD